MHRLLHRQLRRLGLSADTPPTAENWAALLQRVERHYHDADQERYLLERSLTISSQEMRDLYESLRRSSATQITQERDRLQALINTVDNGILLNDADGQVSIFNQKLESLTGYTLAEAQRQPIAIFQRVFPHSLVRRRVLRLMTDVKQKGFVHNTEVPVIIKNGEQRTFAISIARLRQQVIPMYLTVLRDITEQKQAEAALHDAKEAAEAGNRAKSQFLATMSHELRTPLNAIIGFANVLRQLNHDKLTAEEQLYLDRIFANGKHLLSLINDVLDLSKIEAGKSEVAHRSLDVEELIADVVQQMESHVKPAVMLHVDVPSRMQALETDPLKLKQILINLVANALKFTETGEVVVRVFASSTGTPERIDVKDTGIGISEVHQTLIFQPFQQADSTTTRRYGGTGLGLSISQALCHQLDYRLTVQSQLDQGSTFSVHLTAD